jgi:flagellar motor switch protein FliG
LIESKKNNKAAVLYSLIGDFIPNSVLTKLSKEELQKLSKKVESLKKTSTDEEKKVLTEFARGFNKTKSPLNQKIQSEIQKILNESIENDKVSLVESLKFKSRKELSQIVMDEEPRIIALIMCHSNPDEASKLIEDFPVRIQEEIIHEIEKIDFHSEKVVSDLERFLNFKQELIKSNIPLSKVKSRGSKKAAEILTRISPNISSKLFSGIKKLNPLFAEKIDQHFYKLEDLQFANRTSISEFFSEIHPIVIASSLKGIETSLKDKLLEKAEPWLAKQISLEMDSMGPISLAEIEEAQTAVITKLNESIETGKIKLWKV